MTLNIKPETNPFLTLDAKQYGQIVRDYIAARKAKSDADAMSRAAKKIYDQAQVQLAAAMGKASMAICGNAVLSWKDGAPAQATLTLNDGTILPWSSVTNVLVGNVTYSANEIATVYGGRNGSHTLNIEGTP